MIASPIIENLEGRATPEVVRQMLTENTFPIVDESGITFVFVGDADHVSLRHWIYGLPSSLPLSRLAGTDLWYRTVEFPTASRVEYKFGVARDGHEEWIFDPLNDQVANDPYGGNSVAHARGYACPDWSEGLPDVAQGHFDTFSVASKVFGDSRIVRVYVPARFRKYRRYRLLVVHDGDDYVKYSRLNHVLDNLIERHEISPLIVALSNPRDRLREYADDPRHASYIVEELLPELESHYSLIRQPSGRCIMGASFGAVASLSTTWRYPGVFDSILVQSGSFAFTDIGQHSRSPVFDPVVAFMNEFRKAPGTPFKQAYVSCGVYESLIYENRSLVPFLRRHGVETKYEEAYDGHNWENWRDRLRNGLSWLFPGPLWETYM